MLKHSKKAFTLVELIVVITILAILGTIAFISLQGYSKSARDSRRISDISNIKKSLELFQLNTGKYPVPDNGNTLSHSGDVLFIQGTIGDNVTQNLSKNLQEKPTDPLHEIEYVYSTTNTRKEYEVLTILENQNAINYKLLDTSYAFNFKIKTNGNYNGIFIKTPNFIVPTPAIITSAELPADTNNTPEVIDSFVLDGGNNVPDLSIAGVETQTGKLDINLSVYTGTIDGNATNEQKIDVINAIQGAYTGTTLASKPIIENLLSKTTDEEKTNFIDVTILGTGTPIFTSTSSGGGSSGLLSTCSGNGDIKYSTAEGTSTGLTCDDDIGVCSGVSAGIIVKACNVGATEVYAGQTFGSASTGRNSTINARAGGLYQWGNNADVSYAPTSGTLIASPSQDSTYSNPYLITAGPIWTTVPEINLWGHVTDTLEARRGPCPEGYHVPTNAEWGALFTAIAANSEGLEVSEVLNVPMGGYRSRDGTMGYQNQFAAFWCSEGIPSTETNFYGRRINISPTSTNLGISANPAYANAIRCFKNDGVLLSPVNGACGTDNGKDLTENPTNLCSAGNASTITDNGVGSTYNWTCDGIDGGSSVSCSANHISLVSTYPGCDSPDITVGSYTIAACNVGATTSGTDRTTSGGLYFQWGRNKGFTYGDVTIINNTIDGSIGLDASTDTYPYAWDAADSFPTKWASTVITNNWGDSTNTNEARRGPCEVGYHVPTQAEWTGLISAGDGTLWDIDGTDTEGTDMQNALKLPLGGYRHNTTWANQTTYGFYWFSTPDEILSLWAANINPATNDNQARACSVRCFKN